MGLNRASPGPIPPLYPALMFGAWIVTLFADSSAALPALVRPLIVGLALVLLVQAILTLITRNRDIAAVIVLEISLFIAGFLGIAFLSSVALVVVLVASARRSRAAQLPWPSLTRGMNVVAAVTLGLALATALAAGAITPPSRTSGPAVAVNDQPLPDIYLILLDAYPRADTLTHDFGFDSGPFLSGMRARGFTVAANSHSNYNGTDLTLSSLFNARQVLDLPEVAERPASPQAQSRALSRAINDGQALQDLRAAGYEIVSVPSDVSNVTLFNADRVLESGEMNSFEYELLQEGLLPRLFSDAQRRVLIGQHRQRIESTFATIAGLASERPGHPRFIFAHQMAPHAPVSFTADGEPVDGWPCFPVDCPIFYGGQIYRKGIITPVTEQIAYLNGRVEQTSAWIQSKAERPPVIVWFSDHGFRHDFDDPDEMFRSLFVASTPDRAGLFPEDVTPINVIPRLLNAYAGLALPMATEESYVVDMRTALTLGPLNLTLRRSADD